MRQIVKLTTDLIFNKKSETKLLFSIAILNLYLFRKTSYPARQLELVAPEILTPSTSEQQVIHITT